ncbi:MAG: substrate-binding domain-containing protein, partial [Anaerolineae bacterium]|nr:substrate-binding domain-containing protein [Anaerolineae bacterium]
LVAFGRAHSNGSAFPYVDVDGRAGIRQAVEHLLEQGHQRIAFLGWPEQSRVGTDRLSGYLEAMEKAGLSADPAWIMRSAGQYDFGYVAAHTLLDLPAKRRPSAIVTVYDLIAVGAVQAVQEHGLQMGRDVAVTGFDDTPLLPYLLPSLTTLRQPVWEIGQRVVELLVRLFAGEKPGESESHVLLPPELVIRDSSRGYRPR